MYRKYACLLRGILLLLVCSMALPELSLAAVPGDFRDLVKAAGPAVVNISTERTEEVRGGILPPGFGFFRRHPDMERFFDEFERFNNTPQTRRRNSLGSGFIISSDGYIVTNNHVIAEADVIRVTLADQKKDDSYTAEVVGTDPDTDLALLKIEAQNLPSLRFGDSNALEVGEWVLAIGNPLGLDHTVTAGIVSAKGRNIQSGSYDDFLQTDASINPGNSGGPLLNMAGEVIGINTAIAQRAQGIGFAIPSTLAQRIINDLKGQGKVSRGWLGVTIQNVDATTAKALAMKDVRGALIGDALEGQPADRAGLRAGDVILSINGERIDDTDQLLRKVAMLSPGVEARIVVWRDGKEQEFRLVLAERDLARAMGEKGDAMPRDSASARLGMSLRPVSPEEAADAKLPRDTGLMVVSVENKGLAVEAGIVPGDVIVAVNRKRVGSVQDFIREVDEGAKKRGALLLHISRDGHLFFRAIEMPAGKK